MIDLLHNLQIQASRYHRHCAVIHGEQRITYAQLWNAIVSIAVELRQTGLKEGDRVALFMENSAEYIAAYYAVWYAGGCVVAMNTSLKSKELAKLVTHSDAVILIYDAQFDKPSAVSDVTGKYIRLLGLQVRFSGKVDAQLELTIVPKKLNINSLASIIYTSGTTGHPKGVMLSHLNLLSNTNSIIKYLALSCDDKVMCVLPFYYSYGNSVMHTHLAVGATLVLENSFLYPQKVLQVMKTEEVTGFSGVPSTFSLLLTRVKLERFNFPRLRYITQAGGAMALNAIDNFRSIFKNVRFFVMYGQTEASARLTYLKPEIFEEKRGSVGVAIPGVTLKIVDDQNCELNVGEVGEVCARGDNVMLGYLNDPEETKITIDNGWLKTGDTGHLDSEGYLFLVGRNKEMIKSGAHRIAPTEIEEILCEHDMIDEVAIVGEDDELLGQVIKAFIVPRDNNEITQRDVMRFSKKRLPQYKIPKSIEFVTSLPKTASGKVKKHLLIN